MRNGKRKHALLLAALMSALLLTQCSKIENTIAKFEDGLNANDPVKVADTLSKDCVNYDNYANNNWSGLDSILNVWYATEQPYSFSGFDIAESGDSADVLCSMDNSLGTFPVYFLMVKETDFIFKAWKIRQWKVDSAGNGFGDDLFRLQRFLPAR